MGIWEYVPWENIRAAESERTRVSAARRCQEGLTGVRAVVGDSPERSRPTQLQEANWGLFVYLSVCQEIVVAVALVAKLQSDSGEEAGKNGPVMPWFNFFIYL